MTRLVARSWPIDDPGPLLDHLPAHGLAWLQGDDGMVAWGEAVRLDPPAGGERFTAAAAAWKATVARADVADDVGVPGSGLVAFGSFTFDDRSHGSTFVVPEVVVGRRAGQAWATAIRADGAPPEQPALAAPAGLAELGAGTSTGDAEAGWIDVGEAPEPDRPRYAGSSVPDVLWLEAVAAAVERIDAGYLDKVVLARDHALWSRAPFDPRLLARRLNRRFPGCLTFAVDGLVGATPELLVRRFGVEVSSLALAGSAPRGRDPEADRHLGEQLLASKKDRWEHELAARTVHEVLAPRCPDLEYGHEPHLLRLDNVMHLATRFRGTLAEPGESSLSLAGALHPTAAVGGVPTAVALETIRELEGMDRGRYAGPVGWVDAAGDGEWGIALRCAELSGARARLFAGAGIVAGSLPEDELEETRLKLGAMRSAFGDA